MKIVKAIFFAILVGVAAYFCLSAPVRSMLGADGVEIGMEADNPNPYITDGLVAMWDAEWNAGLGIHDADSTKSIDIIGNSPDLQMKGGFISLDTYRNVLIEELEIALNDCTFENIVRKRNDYLRPSGTAFGFVSLVSSSYEGSGFNWRFDSDPIRLRFSYQDRKYNTSLFVGITDLMQFHAETFVSDNLPSVSGYFNGEYCGNKKVVAYDYTLKYLRPNPNEWVEADSLSIRLYNRALTEEEILHNYEIDRERFNLP